MLPSTEVKIGFKERTVQPEFAIWMRERMCRAEETGDTKASRCIVKVHVGCKCEITGHV